jgi:hypothetical protein
VLLEELVHQGHMELEVAMAELARQGLLAPLVLLAEGVLRRLALEEQAEVVPPFRSMVKA